MARQATWKADVLDERQIQKLVQIYSDEERRLSDLILRAIAAGRPTDTYTSFRHQISKELDRLRRVGVPAAQGIVRDSYNLGKREADRLLKEMGAHTSASFAFPHVHREAVNLLVQNVTTRLEDLNQVIGRRVLDIYREISLESLRSQIIGTEAWRAASERFRDDLASRGITGFVDKRGRQWNMTTYVQMVARTTPMEAHLQGTCNRLLENGIDLVKVSDHVDPCEKCAPWEGKVLSISGQTQGYPTVAEARSQGLFHPNCRHATSGYLKPHLEEAQRKEPPKDSDSGGTSVFDAAKLLIRMEKLTGYALNPESAEGGHKATVFDSVLGYNSGNAELLEQAILKAMGESPETQFKGFAKDGSRKFQVDLPIRGVSGRIAIVRTVWGIMEDGTARLVTLYVRKKRKTG
jgi:hypothetical protein